MTIQKIQPARRIQPRKPPPELLHYVEQRPKPIAQQILELRARIQHLRTQTEELLTRLK